MSKQRTKGKTMLSAEVPVELAEQFREYVKGRGEKLSQALERALRRDMAYPAPPPVPPAVPPVPPLPDVPAPKKVKRK